MQNWKTLASRTLHTNPYWSVIENDVITPNGKPGKYYVAHRGPFSALVVINEKQEIYFVQQERYATGQIGWELPMGMIDPGEDALTAAHRELLEETGLKAETVTELGKLESEKGFTDSIGHVFVATGLTQGENTGQAEEGIMACRPFSMDAIKDMIRSGEIHDDFSLACLFMAQVHGHIK